MSAGGELVGVRQDGPHAAGDPDVGAEKRDLHNQIAMDT
jgi:hypothetical protein